MYCIFFIGLFFLKILFMEFFGLVLEILSFFIFTPAPFHFSFTTDVVAERYQRHRQRQLRVVLASAGAPRPAYSADAEAVGEGVEARQDEAQEIRRQV